MATLRDNGLALLQEGDLALAKAQLRAARRLGRRLRVMIETALERMSQVPPLP